MDVHEIRMRNYKTLLLQFRQRDDQAGEPERGMPIDVLTLIADGVGSEYVFAALVAAVAMRGDPGELRLVADMLRALSIRKDPA